MIEYIKGVVDELSPASAVVEAGGIGYGISISVNTYTALKQGAEAKLFVTEVIREDAHILFGFATKDERVLFNELTNISGIGGQTARMVLSSFTPQELITIISSENVGALKGVKGIGPKAAARIVVELRDRIGKLECAEAGAEVKGAVPTDGNRSGEEAAAALVMLGFQPQNVYKVVARILQEDASLSVEQIIKLALKAL